MKFPARLGMLGCLVLAHVATAGEATNAAWSQFRGPNSQGVVPASAFPDRFGPGTNVAWKIAVPPGHSSPVIAGRRLFLTAHAPTNRNELLTLAFDRVRGSLLWQRPVQVEKQPGYHELNNPAAPTPAADADHVYAYFGAHGLLCYDHSGRTVWERRLEAPRSKYGAGSSPILHGETLILALDGDSGSSRLLAVRRATGETVWEQPRPLFRSGWSTPAIFPHDGTADLVVLGYKRLTAYDPATGQERWWLAGFSEETVGIPVHGDGLLFASAAALGGRGEERIDAEASWKTTLAEFDQNHDAEIQRPEMTKGFAFVLRPELPRDNPGYAMPVGSMDAVLRIFDQDKSGTITHQEWLSAISAFAARSHPNLVAIRPGAAGDARPDHVAWELRRGIPETPSLLHHRGRLYLIRDGGLLTCLRAATGEQLFQERLDAPGQYIASPVAAGDRILVASVPGIVTVLAAGDGLRVLSRNDLGDSIFATPALAEDALYLRSAQTLWAFGPAASPP